MGEKGHVSINFNIKHPDEKLCFRFFRAKASMMCKIFRSVSRTLEDDNSLSMRSKITLTVEMFGWKHMFFLNFSSFWEIELFPRRIYFRHLKFHFSCNKWRKCSNGAQLTAFKLPKLTQHSEEPSIFTFFNR